ncbi:hypothetical protein EHJ37_19645 [Vibrio parahaemolyticus]|nr:hypothetical protein [Vibrio parahaemolyticus]
MRHLLTTLLSLLLLLVSNVTLAASNQTSCSENESLCANIYQNNSMYIEAISEIFPESTLLLIEGDNIFKKGIEGIARSFYGVTNAATMAMSDTKITNTVIDVYYDKKDEYDTFLSHYKKDKSSVLSQGFIEKIMIVFLAVVGTFTGITLTISMVIKVGKIAKQDKGFEKIFNNISLQSVMYIILAASIVPFSAGVLPPLGLFILAVSLVGCFIASGFVAMISGVLLEILSSDSVYDVSSLKDNTQFEKQLIELIDKNSDEAAESIVLIDLELANLIVSKDGISKVDDATFRKVFAEDEGMEVNESCVYGEYWHFSIITNDSCKSFREFLSFKSPIASADFQGTWREKLRGFVRSRFDEDYFSDYFDTEDAVIALILDDFMKEVYRRVESRKTQICSASMSGGMSSDSKQLAQRWFCNKFNYKTGTWNDSGETYASEIVTQRINGATKLELNKLAHQIQQDSVVDDVQNYKSSLEAITTSINSKITLDNDAHRIDIDGSNIAKAFFSIVHELDQRYRYSSKITGEAFRHLDRIYRAIMEVSPLVVKSGNGLAETAGFDHREQDCAIFAFFCDPVETTLDQSVEENNLYLNAASKQSIVVKLMDYVRRNEDVEQNIYSASNRFATLAITSLASTKVAASIHGAYKRDRIKSDNPMISDAELDQMTSASKLLNKIINPILALAVGIYIWLTTPILLAVIWKMLNIIFRLIINIALTPVAILEFIWKISDDTHDTDNILIPDRLKNILIRTLIDPVSITISFSVGIIVTLIVYKFSKGVIASISGLFIDQNTVSLPIVFVLEVLLNALLAAYIMRKTAKNIEYCHDKVTEFIDDQTGINSNVEDEVDQLKAILLMGFKK